MSLNQQPAIIIFIKNPEKGKVKTRLAQTVGDERALKIYQALLTHTRDLVSSISAQRYLFYSQFIDQTDAWPNEIFNKALQPSGDLGTRMTEAFQTVLANHSKAIIIGSDCASLSVEIIQAGIEALEDHDFVLGPALDGGYYLLGMTSFESSLFENIPWSTEDVGRITIDKIKAAGKTYATLPTLSDIDYEEDWNKYGWSLE
jgi:hypothetical protein